MVELSISSEGHGRGRPNVLIEMEQLSSSPPMDMGRVGQGIDRNGGELSSSLRGNTRCVCQGIDRNGGTFELWGWPNVLIEIEELSSSHRKDIGMAFEFSSVEHEMGRQMY